jgi:hypothetical protein
MKSRDEKPTWARDESERKMSAKASEVFSEEQIKALNAFLAIKYEGYSHNFEHNDQSHYVAYINDHLMPVFAFDIFSRHRKSS